MSKRKGYSGYSGMGYQPVRRQLPSYLIGKGGYIRKKYKRGPRYGRRRYGGRRNAVTMGYLGIEKKFYDTSLSNAVLIAASDASGGEHDPSATSMISTPVRGDSEQNRDGKQISLLNVSIKGVINVPQTEVIVNPVSGNFAYVALVLDTQTNAAQIVSENVYKNTAGLAKLSAQPQKNLLFQNRFRILKTMCVNITPPTINNIAANLFAYHGVQKKFNWFVDLKGMKVNFNAGTTADIGNVIDNSLHIIAWVNSADSTPTLSYNARIRFVG